MNKKPKVVDKMIDIMLRTIPLQPLPLTLMEQKAKPSSKEYQRFNNMAKRKAGKIALPSLEEMDELDRLKSEYDTLYHTTPEPDDYCSYCWTRLKEESHSSRGTCNLIISWLQRGRCARRVMMLLGCVRGMRYHHLFSAWE